MARNERNEMKRNETTRDSNLVQSIALRVFPCIIEKAQTKRNEKAKRVQQILKHWQKSRFHVGLLCKICFTKCFIGKMREENKCHI